MDRALTYPSATARYDASRRSRPLALVLAGGITLLLFAILITMSAMDAPGGSGSRLVAISIAGEKQKAASASRTKEQTAQRVDETPVTPPAVKIPPAVIRTKNTYKLPDGFIQLSQADMRSADIGRIKSASGSAGARQASAAGGSGDGEGEGEGPGGAKLYNAQWYREPRDAELAGYMPANREPGQWAVIACRTIENYRVEDCREMDESPRGSGMARALRQAAWQFLVRPPRLDGKPMIGAWVRIRFDFTKGKRETGDG